MKEFAREVAKRIFSQEIRDSDFAFRENEDQYAPLYLITPTGARCNRIFLIGVLTERDDIGGDMEYWRGRVVDPTGAILVYAGQYQPDAAQALARTDPPSFVAVVGKPSVYETEDGNRLISVRAESIQKVDSATRDRWILDTSKRTLERLKAFEDYLSQGEADEMADIREAHLHYGTDLNRYKEMAVGALKSLQKTNEENVAEEDASDQDLKKSEETEEAEDFLGTFGNPPKKKDDSLDDVQEISFKE
ncbi:MAG: RPA family protein [Methanotrichaceae archaeon]